MSSVLLLLALGQFIGPSGGVDSLPFGAPPDFSFTAPSPGDYATLTAATGQTVTCSRASTATVRTSAGSTPVSVAANHCAVDYRGLQLEDAATNFLLNSGAPATQTTASLASKQYTGWMEGTGSVAFTVGGATATGLPCTATDGSPCPFTVTAPGTVVATVTGSPTREQLSDTAGQGSYIPTTGTTVTKAGDTASFPKPSGITFSSSDYSIAAVMQMSQYLNGNDSNQVISSNTVLFPLLRANSVSNGTRSNAFSDSTGSSALSIHASVAFASTRYQMHALAGLLFVCVNGTCGSSYTISTQPAEPTTLFLGNSTTSNQMDGFLSVVAMCKGNPAGACAP